MMVNAYPNDIDDARSRRQISSPVPPFPHLCAGIYPHRGGFYPTLEVSEFSISTEFRLFSPTLANTGGARRLEGSSGSNNE